MIKKGNEMQINIIEFVSQSNSNGWCNPGYNTSVSRNKIIGFVTNETDSTITMVQATNNFNQVYNTVSIEKKQITSRRELAVVSQDDSLIKCRELLIKDESPN